MNLRVSAESIANDDEEEIKDGDYETHRESDGGLATVRRNSERNADQSESHAGKGKRKALIDLCPRRAAFPSIPCIQLVEQLLQGKRGSTRPFLFPLVQFFQADRQRPFRHADSVVNLA